MEELCRWTDGRQTGESERSARVVGIAPTPPRAETARMAMTLEEIIMNAESKAGDKEYKEM